MDARVDDNEPDAKEMNDLLFRLMRGVNAQAFRLFGNRVLTGPFTSMIVSPKPHWDDGNASTKLLGCYEHELHDAIDYAMWRRPQVVINVGCAEGYYAIGFAKRGFNVWAFDTSPESLLQCSDLAEQNKVKVNVRDGVKEPEELRLWSQQGHRLYVIDCEGSELELIDFAKCPELVRSDIIVECHDFLHPNASLILHDRLCSTHHVKLIRPQLPDLTQFAFTRQFPSVMALLMVMEKRPTPCYWLTCWAKERGD